MGSAGHVKTGNVPSDEGAAQSCPGWSLTNIRHVMLERNRALANREGQPAFRYTIMHEP